ncbi:MAG: RlmE family RNA methyltransferase [Candidatus Aenigmarchaeota archaeon]|nr:RlmE family RNA methyltransferase [Candidatus Aenigmarchaeota archaeon]
MKKINKQQDFYFKKAKNAGYPARSVYKLAEIDKKYRLIHRDDWILDLGCAPGSWLLYLSEKVGKRGKVIGIDQRDLDIILPDNVLFIKKDIDKIVPADLEKWRKRFSVVVSDLAPSTSGIKFADVEASIILSKQALAIAKIVLRSKGNFVVKIFEGTDSNKFVEQNKKIFTFTKRFKPTAIRKGSKEFYLISKGLVK